MKKVTISIELAEEIQKRLETILMPTIIMEDLSFAIQKAKESPTPFQSNDIQKIKERLLENDRKFAEVDGKISEFGKVTCDLCEGLLSEVKSLKDRVNVLEDERNQITKDWESVYFAKKVKE